MGEKQPAAACRTGTISQTNALGFLAAALSSPLVHCSSIHSQYDNRADDLTKDGMLKGIESSAAFVLFLSTGVLERPYCQMEIRHALALKKPVVLLHGEKSESKEREHKMCPPRLYPPSDRRLPPRFRRPASPSPPRPSVRASRERRAVRRLRLPRRARGGARRPARAP